MKKILKKELILIFAMTLIMVLVSCVPTGCGTLISPDSFKVGISFPVKLWRWEMDAANMQAAFEALGYEVDLQFAGENRVPVQIEQIENMIAAGVDVLVIAAVDGEALTEVLSTAKDRDIQVIAYDRLIINTDAVNYYVAFDIFQVGVLIGEYIRDMLDLDNADGSFNIELFAGIDLEVDDPFLYGSMSILQPYFDSGVLVCPSGQTRREWIIIEGWSTENAQVRMENLISNNNYRPLGGTPLHAVLCVHDSIALGVTYALINAGFEGGDGFPIITGQDCDIASVRNILAGTQSMSVFRDTRILVNQVVEMVNAIATGTEVPVNDITTYNNSAKDIPAFLCAPVIVTCENYQEHLIDSGYYTEAEIFG